jgi:hypothetical protein
VDYDKLDADLSAELDAVADANEATLPVFIHTEQSNGPEQEAFLKQLGVSGEIAGREMLTANLSRQAIDELSRQPWVRYLKLSRKLRPLPGAE